MSDDIYDQLRNQLQVDIMEIDRDLAEIPQIVMAAAEQTAAAISVRDMAKFEVDVAKAEAAAFLRVAKDGKQPSETQVQSEVPKARAVKRAVQVYEDAKLESARWMALTEGLRTKSSALKTIAELIVAGYLTRDAVYQERRRAMQNARNRGDDARGSSSG